MTDDALTLNKMLAAAKRVMGDGAFFATPAAYSSLLTLPKIESPDWYLGRSIDYLGIRVYEAPRHLFRPPEKPLRSRPRRMRRSMTYRKRVRAERVKIRSQTRVFRCRWLKSRKVPDRRGYSQNSVFWFNAAHAGA